MALVVPVHLWRKTDITLGHPVRRNCPCSETDITCGFEPQIPGSNPGKGTKINFPEIEKSPYPAWLDKRIIEI